MLGIYKKKDNRIVHGVLAGLADKYQWDLTKTRLIFILVVLFTPINLFALIAYLVAGYTLPDKGQKRVYYQTPGPRKRKDADIIEDREWF